MLAAKRKEEFGRNIVAPVFFNSLWEDGKWMFIAPPSSNQQYFIFEVILPKVLAINYQHLGYLAFPQFWCTAQYFLQFLEECKWMFIAAVSPAGQTHNISFPTGSLEAIFARTKFHLDAFFFANLQCSSIK